ncbi:hypothetical protein GAP32_417 [Cronobacter phage vB_CsaM_GAP32]|uniref:Uncharacterized protein n=1 Tax=Cronobacter phage vB_CsaM_GAP32 TaxID=1141136 RepID=K4F9P5_9CAUD|nr:hypothetical protein GAP32_417 [Cronobacter phage vB_CsaM_GAP32]AFC21870.1 hypothetical protein GAP32_417 [Cronobacter phage vB_CsaM_GAP32]
MKSILFFQYAATGEGWTTEIRFCNQSRISDEQAIEEFKQRHHEYFHCGIEMHNIDEAKEDKHFLQHLQEHVPALHRYVLGNRDCLIDIDYVHYVNFS